MENKTNKKYDILMIVWGLSLGVIYLLAFLFTYLQTNK